MQWKPRAPNHIYPDDGRDGKPAFTQPRPAQPRERTNSQLVDLFAISWFRVLWASASVIEVAAVPTLRWLLTSGLVSLIFFVLFFAMLSRLSLARRVPAKSWSVTPIHILSHWSTLLSCTLVVSTLKKNQKLKCIGSIIRTKSRFGNFQLLF